MSTLTKAIVLGFSIGLANFAVAEHFNDRGEDFNSTLAIFSAEYKAKLLKLLEQKNRSMSLLEYDQPQFLSYPLKSLISLASPRGHECQSRDIDTGLTQNACLTTTYRVKLAIFALYVESLRKSCDIIFVVHDGFGTLCQIVPLLVSVDLLDEADYPPILYIYT